jgi:hypothetical protein
MTPMEYIQAGRIFIGFEVDDDLLPYMVPALRYKRKGNPC